MLVTQFLETMCSHCSAFFQRCVFSLLYCFIIFVVFLSLFFVYKSWFCCWQNSLCASSPESLTAIFPSYFVLLFCLLYLVDSFPCKHYVRILWIAIIICNALSFFFVDIGGQWRLPNRRLLIDATSIQINNSRFSLGRYRICILDH